MAYYAETGNQARAWFNKWISSPHWNLGGSTVLMAPSEWKRLFDQDDPIALVNHEPIFLSLWGEPGEEEEWWVGNNLSASWTSVGTEFPTIESVLEVMIEVSKRHLESAKWVVEQIETFKADE
jgi:hypothetical protein